MMRPSEVVFAYARQKNKGDLLPKRLRLYISQGWFLWRLCLRAEELREAGQSAAHIDLLNDVEQVIQPLWDGMEKQFEEKTAAKVRVAQMRCDVQVIDGHAQGIGASCARQL